jgi:hypothetical protein
VSIFCAQRWCGVVHPWDCANCTDKQFFWNTYFFIFFLAYIFANIFSQTQKNALML